MGRTERGKQASLMLACCVFAAMFETGGALVHAATADASLGDTPQHQAWDILQAGVSDKSAVRRTQAVARSRTSSRESESRGRCGGSLGR